jgi:Cellulose biosynthesis protein BcsS
VGVVREFAAAVAATTMWLCAAAHADTVGPNNPSFLLFTGSDLWRDGAFLYGGTLWSPAGLDVDGFTLKLIVAGGLYTYPSGGLHTDVEGTLVSASALPGWRVTSDGITIALYAGPIVQDYRLMPYDPGSLLRGYYAGGQLATDVWYQPTPTSMAALNMSVASIGLIGTVRGAVGWQFGEPFFVGPEAQALWCIDYQQWRLGVHVTGLRIDGLEWSAGAGWAVESFGREGPYLRLGVSVRY